MVGAYHEVLAVALIVKNDKRFRRLVSRFACLYAIMNTTLSIQILLTHFLLAIHHEIRALHVLNDSICSFREILKKKISFGGRH